MKKGETTNNINNSKKSASENGLYFINLPQLNNYSQENISQPIFHNNFTNLNDSNILDNIIPPTKQQKKFKFIQHNPIKKKSKNKKEKKISKKKINGNKQHEWNIIDNNICKHKNEISSNKYINIFSESSITTDEIYNLSNIEFECKNCKKIYHIKDLDEHIRTCILDSIKKDSMKYICPNTDCFLEFDSKEELEEHLEETKIRNVVSLHCDICDETFEKSINLNNHYRSDLFVHWKKINQIRYKTWDY